MISVPKEKLIYAPTNGIVLVEIDTELSVRPVKVHEINFTERVYSHRKEFETAAKAVDKVFISGGQQQKLIKISQELCVSGFKQTEPTEVLDKDYYLSIRFVPIGKRNFLECEFYLNKYLEKKGKVRDLFDQMIALEKETLKFR